MTERTAAAGEPSSGGNPPCRGGDRQCRSDLPVFRDYPPDLYRWLRRYEEKGLEGLRDKASRPHYCPHATSAEVVGKIIYLRQNYHFGPEKISMYLKRYHEIDVSTSGCGGS